MSHKLHLLKHDIFQIILSIRAQEFDNNNNNKNNNNKNNNNNNNDSNNRNAMKRLLIKPNHTRGEGMVTSEFVSRKVKGKNQTLLIIKLINYSRSSL